MPVNSDKTGNRKDIYSKMHKNNRQALYCNALSPQGAGYTTHHPSMQTTQAAGCTKHCLRQPISLPQKGERLRHKAGAKEGGEMGK